MCKAQLESSSWALLFSVFLVRSFYYRKLRTNLKLLCKLIGTLILGFFLFLIVESFLG